MSFAPLLQVPMKQESKIHLPSVGWWNLKFCCVAVTNDSEKISKPVCAVQLSKPFPSAQPPLSLHAGPCRR